MAATAATAAQQLLGEDGRGYELARRLEACGVWRAWLGEAAYAGFAHSLASPAAWEAFMRSDVAAGKTRSQIHLQLRARALLFDKASASLFLSAPAASASRSSSSSQRPSMPASPGPSNLNPAYLQLHGDDVYFSLEDNAQEGMQQQDCSGVPPRTLVQPVAQSRAAFSSLFERKSDAELRYNGLDNENMAQRNRLDDVPEAWYSQCVDRFKKGKPWKFPLGERESTKRSPDSMSAYVKLLEAHKKKRQVFREETHMGTALPMRDNGSRFHLSAAQEMSSSVDDDVCLLPEMMFPANCVPDSALPPPNTQEENQKMDVYGVLDSLPQVISQSPAMMERFGIRPDLKVEFGRSKYRGKYGPDGSRKLSPEQASQITQKVIARVLGNVGLEGGTEVSMEVLSKFMAAHICKLGRLLKILSDSYRKQFSSTELLKMFSQTAGLGSFAALADHIKDANKNLPHQSQQHMRALQTHPNHLQQQQMNQIQRPVQAQLNTSYSQNFAFQQQLQQQQLQQQQLQQLRQRQASTPRGSGMTAGNSRPMVEVKMENVVENASDGAFNSHNKQQQFRHQQMANSNHHVQPGHQFKQMASVQVPQLQSQNSFSVRTPPVKVEGFEELMGGDTTLKHDGDEHKLTSPSK